MRRFAALYDALDQTTGTAGKVAALVAYFREAPAADAAWAIAFLTGRRPRRVVKMPLVRAWAAEAAGIPAWLFEESYQQVGDLAETIALLIPGEGNDDTSLASWVEDRLLPLRELDAEAQRVALLGCWARLGGTARFLFTKLLTGAFRVGVSDGLVVRALAEAHGLATDVVSHRLMGDWEPSAAWYEHLVSAADALDDARRPYPFCLAHPLEGDPASLGAREAWLAEWKWDGIRAQLLRRRGAPLLWSRGEELLTGRFPEVEQAAAFLPEGTVLDGELLAWRDGAPLPFGELQRRINRKTVGARLLAEVPVALVVYDLLEAGHRDLRAEPLAERRARLDALLAALPSGAPIHPSPAVEAAGWEALAARREESRARGAEGLMLKRLASAYAVGRKVGDWWKWKVVPYTIDAVLVAAQPGHGKRAGLFTDYTFALHDGDALVTVAKAYSGLTDAEIREVDRYVRANTVDRFGPVRTVTPGLVFELAFEGLQRSTRHKSGIAVRFPRIARWRHDKTPADADTLDALRALLPRAAG